MFFLLFSSLYGAEKYPNSTKMTLVVGAQSKALAAKHGLSTIGFGTEGPGETKGYILQYKMLKNVGIDDARIILVHYVDELLTSIHMQAKKKKLLKEPPDFRALYVSIRFKDRKNGFGPEDGFLANICLYKGKIQFTVGIPGTSNLKPIHSEPYEEAYRIVMGGENRQ